MTKDHKLIVFITMLAAASAILSNCSNTVRFVTERLEQHAKRGP